MHSFFLQLFNSHNLTVILNNVFGETVTENIGTFFLPLLFSLISGDSSVLCLVKMWFSCMGIAGPIPGALLVALCLGNSQWLIASCFSKGMISVLN